MNWEEKFTSDITEVKERTARVEQKVDHIGEKIDRHIEVDSKRLDQVEGWVKEKQVLEDNRKNKLKRLGIYAAIVSAFIGLLTLLRG